MNAFHRLGTCRQLGMGIGPIPWSAIEDYAVRYGLDEYQAHALKYHMARMDDAYLTWVNRKK
jgi:hypothetical protein